MFGCHRLTKLKFSNTDNTCREEDDGSCPPKKRCDPSKRYREEDGSCNNLANPSWGQSGLPYLRLLERRVYLMYCSEDIRRTTNSYLAKPSQTVGKLIQIMSRFCPILCRQHSLVDCGRASHLPNARLVSQALIRRGEFDVSPEASIMVMIYGQGGSFSSGFVSSLRYLYIKGAPRWFFSDCHFSF